MIDRIKSYYNTIILPKEMFEDNGALTPEEEEEFVSTILADPNRRRLIEKHLMHKVGVNTRAAMRSPDDDTTRKHKERAYSLGEVTYDYKVIWERVHARRQEAQKKETSKPSRFRFFGDPDEQEE